MEKSKKADINKVSNNQSLKSIFSYINYLKILKIVQKNKRLQTRLGINIQNYKDFVDFPKYEYNKIEQIVDTEKSRIHSTDGVYLVLFPCCCFCILFIYSLIYSILLVSLDSFDDSNTKEYYNKSFADIIKKINVFTFILDGIIVSNPLILMFYIFNNDYYSDYGIKKIIKSLIIIIINLSHIIFEGIIIWKLYLSYKIKKGGLLWFMRMDYTFLVLNFFCFLYVLLLSVIFFRNSGKNIAYKSFYVLESFNGIKINNFILPFNFDKWDKKDRKKFILKKYHVYEYKNSTINRDLVNSINSFRRDKNISTLFFDEFSPNIPDFIVKKPLELLLNSDQNIFKISDKKYLIKLPIGIFKSEFEKRNPNIIKILLNDELDTIQIIPEGEYENIIISRQIQNDMIFEIDNENGNENDNENEDEIENIKEWNLNYYSKDQNDYHRVIKEVKQTYIE